MSSLREVPGKMFQLAENRQEAGRELRDCVVETLQELMKDDDKITALEADLGGASGFTKIKKTNLERFIQCGIAEANMMGVAAGLSLTGFKPFTHTFAPFATRRVFDQLFLSGAYAGNTINVYGSDPGFSVASNGGTHTAWEDVALIREIPGAVICDPADDVQMEWIIKEFLKMEGIHYVRSNRKAVRNVYKKGSSFKIGQGNILKEGKDILIIAAGQLVSEALDCAEELEKEGYSVEVIDMFTIKPLDEKLLIKEAKGKSKIVTIENHSIYGGLGSAVSEVIAENGISVPVKRIGVKEKFGQVGTAEFLQEEFGLTAKQIKETICQF
jgi:transketolase